MRPYILASAGPCNSRAANLLQRSLPKKFPLDENAVCLGWSKARRTNGLSASKGLENYRPLVPLWSGLSIPCARERRTEQNIGLEIT
jgi:hypothetical protein